MSLEWHSPCGRVSLYCGDSLAALAAGKIPKDAAIVADPPYGMGWCPGKESCGFFGGNRQRMGRSKSKGRDWPDIHGEDKPFDPSPWIRFPKCVLFGANHFASRLPIGTTLVWQKKTDRCLDNGFLSDAEVAWMKGGKGVYIFRKPFAPPSRAAESGDGRACHPTMKPVDVMAWCIRKARAPEGGMVCDPYMGSGSTGVAAVREGRRFLGFEVSPEYFAHAVRRISAALAVKQPELIPA